MMKLVEFQTEGRTPIAINTSHVINVEPDPDHASQAVIRLSDGAGVTVFGPFAEVVNKLNAG
jgi:hypothetical protein